MALCFFSLFVFIDNINALRFKVLTGLNNMIKDNAITKVKITSIISRMKYNV